MLLFWKYMSFLLWLSYVLIASVLLFSRGFLLSRYVIDAHSVCSSDRDIWSTVDNFRKDYDSFYQPCPNSKFKVILIVIDALRYDFVEKSKTSDKFYHNRLKSIQKLLEVTQNRTRLYKFIADPPTTTMQRLHGLMTGSLPTFIDVGSNFASTELLEDNLLNQLKNAGKKIIFLGDDTWMSLFPKQFHKSFPFPSFNVWDLDTVDKGVTKHIFQEIEQNSWDLLIGHYLGVDHCGHRYGPNHPEMDRKLTEMDHVITKIVEKLDNKTFLFVFGDHGMTEYGDHGGSSKDEVTAALFIKSPVDLVYYPQQNVIRQIDLLPTLSTILGVAIPFSNLGSIIIDALPSSTRDLSVSANLNHLIPSMRRNVDQATLYIKKYSSWKYHFPKKALNHLFEDYKFFQRSILEEDVSVNYLEEGKQYLERLRAMCESIWAQFNYPAMIAALFLHVFSIFIVLSMNFEVGDEFEKRISKNFTLSIMLCLITSLILSVIVHGITDIDLDMVFYFFTITCSFLYFIFLLRKWKLNNLFEVKERVASFLGCFLFGLSVIGLLTNSYIMSENDVVSFLMLTFIWITFLRIVLKKKKILENNLKGGNKFFLFKNYFLLFLSFVLSLIVRGSHYYWQCYDENTGKCQIFKVSSVYSNIFAILFFFNFRKYFMALMSKLGVRFGNTFHSWFYKNVPGVCFILLSIHWLQESLKIFHLVSPFPIWAVNIFPKVVCVCSLVGIVMLFCSPLSTFLDKLDSSDDKLVTLKAKGKDIGLNNVGTVFSSVFLLLILMLSTLGVVLLGERRCLSCFMMFTSIGSFLVLLSLLKVDSTTNQNQMFHISWWEVAAWYISSLVSFYGTGHQPTFSSLQWDSVVIFGESMPLLLHGALVVMNTFISQIVHSLLLPLLLFAPFTISHVLSRSSTLDDGEYVLFKRKYLRRQLMYSLITKSIVLMSLRVLGIMVSCSIHARHLMVWKVFAPKFVFEAVGLMISLPSLILGFLLVERICQQIQNLKKKQHFEIIFN